MNLVVALLHDHHPISELRGSRLREPGVGGEPELAALANDESPTALCKFSCS
jgi:hypothetical protein